MNNQDEVEEAPPKPGTQITQEVRDRASVMPRASFSHSGSMQRIAGGGSTSSHGSKHRLRRPGAPSLPQMMQPPSPPKATQGCKSLRADVIASMRVETERLRETGTQLRFEQQRLVKQTARRIEKSKSLPAMLANPRSAETSARRWSPPSITAVTGVPGVQATLAETGERC